MFIPGIRDNVYDGMHISIRHVMDTSTSPVGIYHPCILLPIIIASCCSHFIIFTSEGLVVSRCIQLTPFCICIFLCGNTGWRKSMDRMALIPDMNRSNMGPDSTLLFQFRGRLSNERTGHHNTLTVLSIVCISGYATIPQLCNMRCKTGFDLY